MIDEPVEYPSDNLRNPNGAQAQMISSSASRERWRLH